MSACAYVKRSEELTTKHSQSEQEGSLHLQSACAFLSVSSVRSPMPHWQEPRTISDSKAPSEEALKA